MKHMKRYKIHAVNTVLNEVSSSNGHFYDTQEEAIAQCKSYLRQPNSTADGFVVFEATLVIERASPPIQVTDLVTGEIS